MWAGQIATLLGLQWLYSRRRDCLPPSMETSIIASSTGPYIKNDQQQLLSKVVSCISAITGSCIHRLPLLVTSRLGRHMAYEIDVVVKMADKVLADVLGSVARVADELAFGHLVLDVRAGQVYRQQDERVAEHIHRIWRGEMDRM